ncbi:hypothetical protein KC19_4G151300 [Ceratodon purpureus]|uniref:Uncharacterized protein n=1 Tax=Ceratodon purpureus TaxID=3225 RepID=A0A8T0IBC9_CERPU|nr:hypothetical protein KC19_4G148400 [Ceratodon purpureus]KAG0580149.1 hypothetical protein KC19_4G151300 [Ceratodon purpureus]
MLQSTTTAKQSYPTDEHHCQLDRTTTQSRNCSRTERPCNSPTTDHRSQNNRPVPPAFASRQRNTQTNRKLQALSTQLLRSELNHAPASSYPSSTNSHLPLTQLQIAERNAQHVLS